MDDAADKNDLVQISKSTHLEQRQKMHDLEERLKTYESVSEQVQEEFQAMQYSLERERMKSDKAASIASHMYRQNTILKNRSRRISKTSKRHKSWQQQSKASVETEESFEEDVDKNEDEDNDVLIKEIEAIQSDSGLANDLESARQEIIQLKTECNSLNKKLQEVELENSQLKENIYDHEKVEKEATSALRNLHDELDMESHVRMRAEKFAAELYGENKSWKRQSTIYQSKRGNDDTQLKDALKEITELNKKLEMEKVEKRQKIEELEEIISSRELEDTSKLEEDVKSMTDQVRQLTEEKNEIEEKCENLKMELEEARKGSMSSTGATVPAPPPAPPIIPPPPPILGVVTAQVQQDPLNNLKELVKQRKAARLGDGNVQSEANNNDPAPVDKYGDAMAEMMKRIKEGNVQLKRANRRFSEAERPDIFPEEETGIERFNLRDASKAATIDVRLKRSSTEDASNGDIFDEFRKGLKPRIPSKAATLDMRIRRSSDPSGPSIFNVRSGLRSVPGGISKIKGSAVDEMRKLSTGLKPFEGRSKVGVMKSSVRHPNEISPELRKILDRKRQIAKQKLESE